MPWAHCGESLSDDDPACFGERQGTCSEGCTMRFISDADIPDDLDEDDRWRVLCSEFADNPTDDRDAGETDAVDTSGDDS